MNKKEDTFNILYKDLLNSGVNQQQLQSLIEKIKKTQVHILLVGATGSGKSSTINALFNTEHAKVGTGTDPETQEIAKYELDNIVLWDSPGLGESPEADKRHIAGMRAKLLEKGDDNNLLIDLVLLIVDGSSRDMSSTFTLLEEVIIPGLNDETDRLLVAINQADLAMKGKHWDSVRNEPQEQLVAFLKEKVESIRRRIWDSKGLELDPIYYCAGDLESDGTQRPYNLGKLMAFILEHVKTKKRVVFIQDMNKTKENFSSNDEENYDEKIEDIIQKSWSENINDFFKGTVQTVGGVLKDVVTSEAVKGVLVSALVTLLKKK